MTACTAAVIVPFCAKPGDARYANMMLVNNMYYEALPEMRWLLTGCFGPGATNIADARNSRGFARLPEDVLVFNDADSLCQPEQIREAVRLAEEAPGLVFAFDVYSRLADVPIATWKEAFEAPVEWSMFNSLSSGCIAIRRECFEQVGGYDETWQYGFEDYDFAQRCAKLWPIRRVRGELVHLWHPRPAVEPEDGPDAKRYVDLYG